MINKKYMAALAAGILTCGLAVSAWAAPGKFTIQADELDYDMKSGVAVGKGHVVIIQEDGKATADNATYNSKTKSGSLTGNVVADRGDQHITCNTFNMENDKIFSAVGDAKLSKEGKTLHAPRVDYNKVTEYAETIGNWATLTDADGSTVSAVKIIYDGKLGLATATGGVTVTSDARKLNASATQDGNTVKGDKLRLTNANVAVGDGNVHVQYIPEAKPQQPAQEENKAVAVKDPVIVNKETEIKA